MKADLACTPLDEHQRRRLVAHALAAIFAGLAGGAVYTVLLSGRLELWPLPPLRWTVAGDAGAWSRTHTGPLLNALLVLALAGVSPLLHWRRGEARAFCLALLVTLWGNTCGYFVAAVSGSRGLSAGQGPGNHLAYLLFLIAALGVLAALALAALGLRRRAA
ncbi:MAG: hypothetical protein EPO12_19155 [Aquabacterium sp.]|jgi:hypothetical protein|nr:MAG: hypothetical protein EPO12_19155 [Aquabacterium sp.]